MKRIIDRITSDIRHDCEPYCAYMYDLLRLKEHAQHLMSTLPSFCRLFYALKANSAEPVIRTLAPLVHGFEVASLGEIKKVRSVAADIPIIFGGPVKTDIAIEEAIRQRVQLIHVESRHELLRIARIAEQHDVVVAILLRVNICAPLPDATLFMAGSHSQFGIDEREIPDMIDLAQSLAAVKLEGFHLHSLSNNLSFARHIQLVSHYCDLVMKWTKDFGLNITYLNAGGGIGVNYDNLQEQFDWASFVEALNEEIRRQCPDGLIIVFECGRYIAALCGYYAAEVVDIKDNHDKSFVLIRGGTHHFRLPSSWQHSHPFQVVPIEGWAYPFPRLELQNCRITVAGELCTPKDVLARECHVSAVRVGDILVFEYAGAYGWEISHHDFLSHPHPHHIYLE